MKKVDCKDARKPHERAASRSRGSSRPPVPRPATAEKDLGQKVMSPVTSYLRVFSLQQYAKKFFDAGYDDLQQLAQMNESKLQGLMDQFNVLPGHRTKLVRCVAHLRSQAPDSPAQKDMQGYVEEILADNCRLQEELRNAQFRVKDLEELVADRTSHAQFLTGQLSDLVQREPSLEQSLYQSFDAQGSLAKMKPILNDVSEVEEAGDEQVNLGSPRLHISNMPPPAQVIRKCESDVQLQSARRKEAREKAPKRIAMSLDCVGSDLLSRQDVDQTIRYCCIALQNHIILGLHARQEKGLAHPSASGLSTRAAVAFLNPEHQPEAQRLSRSRHEWREVYDTRSPHLTELYAFWKNVTSATKMEPECNVIALIYLERMLCSSGITVLPDNWKRLVIVTLLLASKVWDDESYDNSDFARAFPLYTLEDINRMERTFLTFVEYRLAVKTSDYARSYFVLRTLAAKEYTSFPLKPLDQVNASRLQSKAKVREAEARQQHADPLSNTL